MILAVKWCNYPANEYLNANNNYYFHFNIYEQNKCHTWLFLHDFIISWPDP